MDIKKIIHLAKELQDELPFSSEGITSKEQHVQAIAILDVLTDDYSEEYMLLLDVLFPVIERYENTNFYLTNA